MPNIYAMENEPSGLEQKGIVTLGALVCCSCCMQFIYHLFTLNNEQQACQNRSALSQQHSNPFYAVGSDNSLQGARKRGMPTGAAALLE